MELSFSHGTNYSFIVFIINSFHPCHFAERYRMAFFNSSCSKQQIIKQYVEYNLMVNGVNLNVNTDIFLEREIMDTFSFIFLLSPRTMAITTENVKVLFYHVYSVITVNHSSFIPNLVASDYLILFL